MSATPSVAVDEGTAARAGLYSLLADAFEFPSREFHADVASGAFREGIAAAVASLPYALAADLDLDALADAGGYVDFQAEYIRLFDVGVARPPCPLYGGEWGSSRKHWMEDALRFYRFFGLKMDEKARQLPDHVTVELEFLQVLAFAEGMARARDTDVASFLRAQRDFIERHPGRWWPMLQRKIGTYRPSRFYEQLAALTGAVLAADLAYVRSLI